MKNKFLTSVAVLLIAALAPVQALALGTVGPFPTLLLKNRFGEQSLNTVIGGSYGIDCNFIVDSTNGNGLGIRSLKGSGCLAVYGHTSATPASGNPNPAAGYFLIQLASNYAGYIGGYQGFVSPLSGSSILVASAGVVAGNPYVITTVGTTTASGWQSLGLPTGVTPNPGAAFIATSTTTATGTGAVQAPSATGSGVLYADVIGDANQTVSATGGATIILRTLGATNSSTTTLAATAPANNTVIGIRSVYVALPNVLK